MVAHQKALGGHTADVGIHFADDAVGVARMPRPFVVMCPQVCGQLLLVEGHDSLVQGVVPAEEVPVAGVVLPVLQLFAAREEALASP